jgi:hypothetical protein
LLIFAPESVSFKDITLNTSFSINQATNHCLQALYRGWCTSVFLPRINICEGQVDHSAYFISPCVSSFFCSSDKT